MTDSSFPPGALIRDNRSMVGRVVAGSGSAEFDGKTVDLVTVDFWGEKQRRPADWLTLLERNSPEALLYDRPAELEPWAGEAPLKLVALALYASGGKGKVASIRQKLDGRVPGIHWEGWWKKALPQMRELPEHFGIARVGKDSEYSLLTSVDAVPSASQLKPPKTAKKKGADSADWRRWLESGAPVQPPGRFPARQVADSFPVWSAKWSDKAVNDALFQFMLAAEEFLSSGNASALAAEGWLRAVAQAALRWRETGQGDIRGYTAARVGGTLARLSRATGDRTPQELLLQAGALAGEADAWRRGFAAGMWDAFDGEDARDLYIASSAVLGRQARSDLARELFLAAFGPDFPAQRRSGLDRLLDALPAGEREQLLREIIISAPPDERENVLDYADGSRHFGGAERQDLRLLAALTLGNAQSEFVAGVSREMADVLTQPDKYSEPVQAVFLEGAIRAEAANAKAQLEARRLQQVYEEQIERERQEQERLKQQVRERNADLAARREESRLEIRWDMLIAVGEVLQSVYSSSPPEETVCNVEAGLRLALRAGAAETLDSAPEGYDARLHKATEALTESTPVRVIAPGVIVRGGAHGDRVLLKAHVTNEVG